MGNSITTKKENIIETSYYEKATKQFGLAFHQGRYDEALKLQKQTLIYLEKNEKDPTSSLDFAECHNNLGKTYWRLGQIEEALEHFRLSLDIKERIVPDSLTLAMTLSNIGCVYKERAEYEKALYLLEGSLRIREREVNTLKQNLILRKKDKNSDDASKSKEELRKASVGLALSHTNVAIVMQNLSRTKEAIEHHQEARIIKEEMVPGSVSLANTYTNLGNICTNHGQVSKGVSFLKMAEKIARKKGKNHPSLVGIWNNMGMAVYKQGSCEEGISYCKKAIQLEESLAPDSLHLADLHITLANLLEDQGKDLVAARASRSASLDIRVRKAPTYLERGIEKKK